MDDDFSILNVLLTRYITQETDRDEALSALRRISKSHDRLDSLRRQELQEKRILSNLLDKTSDDLENAIAQAREATRAKSAFLANMSHELRTPLNAIIGYVDLILTGSYGELSDVQHDRLSRVSHNARHLLGLINDILDLSKIEAGKMDIVPQLFDVKTIVHQAVDAARPIANRNENELIVGIPAKLGIMETDPTRLRQVLYNLLTNACKFTSEGQVIVTAERYERDDEEWMRFSVEDTGIGMNEEQLDHIFDEFVQGDDTPTRIYEGTGLGLAITRRLCDILGGNIMVESVLGEGSVFTVEVPAFHESVAASR
jgi:signal transduction histidine kinase